MVFTGVVSTEGGTLEDDVEDPTGRLPYLLDKIPSSRGSRLPLED